MGTTRFTGPLHVGSILTTSGTTLGNNVANVGSAVLAQSQAGVTQASGATGIVIPANSHILSITLMVTTVWSGAAATFGVGSTASATAFTAAAAATGATLGPVAIAPGALAPQIANWDNVGTTDVQLAITSTNTGAGVGTLTVTYVQNQNLAS